MIAYITVSVLSKLFMGVLYPLTWSDHTHCTPFISWKYHLEMPLLSSYLPLSDIYHNCTYQLNSCTIVDCILGLNLARYAHASYTNDTVIHDDVIMNDVISNSTLSAPPLLKKSGENTDNGIDTVSLLFLLQFIIILYPLWYMYILLSNVSL